MFQKGAKRNYMFCLKFVFIFYICSVSKNVMKLSAQRKKFKVERRAKPSLCVESLLSLMLFKTEYKIKCFMN